MSSVSPRRTAPLAVALALALVVPATLARADDQATTPPTKPTITREVIGQSVKGRPIELIHRAYDGAPRRVLVIGNLHGDEQAGMRVVRRLVTRWDLPRELDLWMIKTANPDGVAARTRTNARGVDLNRNFGVGWRPSAHGPTWPGPRPSSEPETVLLRRVVRRIDPWLVVIFHQPLLGVGKSDKRPQVSAALGRAMALPVNEFNCGSVCHGTFTSWINARTDGVGITVEFARTASDWRIWKAGEGIVEVGAQGVPPRPVPTPTPTPTPTPSPTPTPTPTDSSTPTPTPTDSTPTPTPS